MKLKYFLANKSLFHILLKENKSHIKNLNCIFFKTCFESMTFYVNFVIVKNK